MAVLLAGGCRVTGLKQGAPRINGTLSIWPLFGRVNGTLAISLRVLEFATGISPVIQNRECDEVLYVLSGSSTLTIDSSSCPVEAETGIYLRPGASLTIDNPHQEPLVVISSQCPEPLRSDASPTPIEQTRRSDNAERHSPGAQPSIVRLADRKSVPTGDRWYRVLVDEELGSTQVTQFVGSIPPGRAPDHFHHYEEVLVILRGEGRMWAGETHTPIARGSCIYLPKGQVHCVENTGEGELRLLGVFYPAGSPSVSYENPTNAVGG